VKRTEQEEYTMKEGKATLERSRDLDIVILFGQRGGGSLLQLLGVFFHECAIDLDFGRSQGRSGNKFKRRISDELPCEPKEGLLEVVIRLSGDFIVLEVLLSVESNGASLDFPLLDVNFVSAENNGDVLADALEVTMPVGDVLVCDSGGDVEHDDTALSLDVVSVTETTEFLLACSVPHIEADCAKVGAERQRVDFHAECGDVFFFEFTSQVALNECGLSGSTVTNKDKLESRNFSGHYCKEEKKWKGV